MSELELKEFVPIQGRTVVYGFRNPHVWESTDDGLRIKEGAIGDPFIYRPAQIVRVWTQVNMKTVNLVVFLDGSNDSSLHAASASVLTLWKTSAVIGDGDQINRGNEHYLPRAPIGYSGN